MPVLAEIDYSLFPPINASLNALSGVFLIVGLVLIKSGRPRAHTNAMLCALVSSAVFLGCYLFYHYGTGHTEFPKEYPTARKVYFAILIPHIILAVVNLPFIVLLVVAAFRGKFVRHKKIARLVFPSWLFVSITGVVIYLMLYQWYLPSENEAAPAAGTHSGDSVEVIRPEMALGDLVFRPGFQAIRTSAAKETVEVEFKGTNRSNQPIKIKLLESRCACLSVEIDTDPVPPGETATVTGVFDISKMRGISEKRIMISTEQHPEVQFLRSRIEIAPIYTIEPSMTSWKIGEDPETKIVEFRVAREEPIHILSAESKREEVSCQVEVVEEGRAYNLRLTPDSTENTLLGIVRIETDCELEHHARPLIYFSVQ